MRRAAYLLLVATFIPFLVVPATAQQENISLSVPAFNQAYVNAAGYWGNCPMGTNGCTDVVASAGCLITSFAMVLDYYGVELSVPAASSCTGATQKGMDPGILNDWLKTHGGYGQCGDGSGACCLEWTNLPPQISITTYVNRNERGLAADARLIIDRSLRNGHPIICGVHWGNHCHGTTGQTEDCHWVVVTGKTSATYTIIDPYNSDTAASTGVKTTLDHGVFGSYTIDRYVIVSGPVPAVPQSDLRISLSFSPDGVVQAGQTQVRSLTVQGSDGATPLFLYTRVIDPNGNVRYAYHTSTSGGTLHYSRSKRSLYPAAQPLSDGTFIWGEEPVSQSEAGTWTWEAWAEDPSYPGRPLGYEIAAYTISTEPASSTTAGILIAIALTLIITGAVYASILLRSGP